MTAADTFEAVPGAAERAIFIDGINKVLAATGLKAAFGPENWADT
jgi:hypothetical protein